MSELQDVRGRWKAGNKASAGFRNGGGLADVLRAKPPEYLRELYDVVTVEDWREICEKTVAQAKEGSWRARDWLADRLMGKAIEFQIHGVLEESARAFLSGLHEKIAEAMGGDVVDARFREIREDTVRPMEDALVSEGDDLGANGVLGGDECGGEESAREF